MKLLISLIILTFLTTSCEKKPDVCPETYEFSGVESCVEINLDAEIRNMPVCSDENCPLKAWGKRSKIWKKKVLRVEYIGGDREQRAMTTKNIKYIESLCALKFQIGSFSRSDLRIAFNQNDGHWSYVGTDCSSISESGRTMNIALNKHSSEQEWRRVVQHETLHALGFHHSQQNPKHKIPWDEAKVIRYYEMTQGWSEMDIRHQVLNRGSNFNTFNTGYDAKSIMHYPVDNSLTKGDFEVDWNSEMSKKDIVMLQRLYGESEKETSKQLLLEF